jgi:hypothetical protein
VPLVLLLQVLPQEPQQELPLQELPLQERYQDIYPYLQSKPFEFLHQKYHIHHHFDLY